MGEFDLSLIVEFRSRPSLYDRNSSQFKDKLFNAQQWQEISNKLGYDVSILKDRMLQLRNRYNLEKRRMEQLREESPGKFHESPWPLYESLQFLSEHIKARRRYKNMIPLLNPKDDSQTNDSGNEYSTLGPDDTTIVDAARDEGHSFDGTGGGGVGAQPFPNGLFAVKLEGNYSEEQEPESDAEADWAENGANHNNVTGNTNVMTEIHSATSQYRQQMQRQQQLQQRLQQQQQQQQNAQTHILPTRIIKRSLYNNNSGLDDHHSQTPQMSAATGGLKRPAAYNHVMTNEAADCSAFMPHKQARLSPRENKYNAFGNFISSSLLDLPQKMALELVEKFTTDVVKALTMKVENMEAAAAAAAAADQLSQNDQ